MSRMFNIASGVSLGVAIFLAVPAARAAICFLPDCADKVTDVDSNVDAQKCRDEG